MNNFPSLKKMQRSLWLFGLIKIPMIAFCRPKIIIWNENEVVLSIKNSRLTNNHFKSLYFGALMVGSDLAAGMHAFAYMVENKQKISISFKSCKADFFQRPDKHVFFNAKAGDTVRKMIDTSVTDKIRVHEFIEVVITDSNQTVVAKVKMELSIKVM
jgi:hypothetical protein